MENMDDPNECPAAVLSGKQKVTEMIEKRHKERQQNLDLALEAKLKNNEATETIDYFLDTFNEQARDIEQNLANMDSPDKAVLAIQFDRAAKSVQHLQTYLSSSTRFLPDSVVQRNQRTLQDLTTQLDTVKAKLLPKKKFGFRSSKAPPPTPVAPPAVAEPTTKTLHPSNTAHSIDWTILNKQNQEILLEDTEVNGKDITMSSLSNCLVRIVGHAGSLQLSNVHNCLVLCGPVARSVFVDNCTESTLAFGCQQFRLHSSRALRVYMHVTCRAIVEDCHDIQVAPFSYAYPSIDLDFTKADLDATKNNWLDVADFNWLSSDKPSPNWRELPAAERVTDWSEVETDFRRKNAIG